MSEKAKRSVVIIGLAISIALILWLTLFSRLGSDSRHFFPPFWSYKAIASGSKTALFEAVGNIIIFIPIGIIVTLVLRLNLWQTIVTGFTLSLLIECSQWFFWLGSFEIDDLFHNTIGTVISSILIDRTVLGQKLRWLGQDRKKNAAILFLLVAIFIFIPIGYQRMKVHAMVRYAALNDRPDGTKNLLTLSPDPRYIGQTDFNVFYNSDGSILIEGYSENRAWIEIGRFNLPEGEYIFSGLSGTSEKTVAIELECFDRERNKYIRLTKDIGPIDEVMFSLDAQTRIRALIGVYAGAEGQFLARPVIYREE